MPVERNASTAKIGRGHQREPDGGEIGHEVSVARLQHEPDGIAGNGEQAGMAERHQAAVADQHVEREREHRPVQDLGSRS